MENKKTVIVEVFKHNTKEQFGITLDGKIAVAEVWEKPALAIAELTYFESLNIEYAAKNRAFLGHVVELKDLEKLGEELLKNKKAEIKITLLK